MVDIGLLLNTTCKYLVKQHLIDIELIEPLVVLSLYRLGISIQTFYDLVMAVAVEKTE